MELGDALPRLLELCYVKKKSLSQHVTADSLQSWKTKFSVHHQLLFCPSCEACNVLTLWQKHSLIATLWPQRFCLTSTMHFVFNVIQKKSTNTLSVNNYSTSCRCFPMPVISWKSKTNKEKGSLFPCKNHGDLDIGLFSMQLTQLWKDATDHQRSVPIYKGPECINKHS